MEHVCFYVLIVLIVFEQNDISVNCSFDLTVYSIWTFWIGFWIFSICRTFCSGFVQFIAYLKNIFE